MSFCNYNCRACNVCNRYPNMPWCKESCEICKYCLPQGEELIIYERGMRHFPYRDREYKLYKFAKMKRNRNITAKDIKYVPVNRYSAIPRAYDKRKYWWI